MIDLTLKITGARNGQDLLDALQTAMCRMIRQRIHECADGEIITGATNGNAEFQVKVARQNDQHQPNVNAIRGRILEHINDGLSDQDIGFALRRTGIVIPLREIAGIVRACAKQAPAQYWECPQCKETLSLDDWSYAQLAADGTPVCGNCEGDMELQDTA